MKTKPMFEADILPCCETTPVFSLGTYYRIVCPVCAYKQVGISKQHVIRVWNEILKLTPRTLV